MSGPGGSGAGSSGAGVGPAGGTVAPDTTPRTRITEEGAPLFDPATRTYVFRADGHLRRVHPVIHRAIHLLTLRRRALASSPDQGLRLRRIRHAREDEAQRVVEDEVALALLPLTSAGELRIDRVELLTPWNGAWVTYVHNLRDPNAPLTPISGSLED